MASTPQQLMTGAACFDCVPQGEQLPVLIYLFARIAGVSTDPNILMANASCYSCIPPGEQLAVLILLADQIASGGGGGATCLLCGAVAPSVTPVCNCALYYDTAASAFWYWDNDPLVLAWVQFF